MPVAAQQGQHLDRIDAPGDRGHRVAVGGKQPVLLAQGQDRADLRRLLAVRRRVYRQPPLPGQGGRLGVEAPGQHHPAIELQEDVVSGHIQIARHGPAVRVHQGQRRITRQQPQRLAGGRHFGSYRSRSWVPRSLGDT